MNEEADETDVRVPAEPTLEPIAETQPQRGRRSTGAIVIGLVFVLLGVVFFLDEAWPGLLEWRYVWPIGLVAVGLAIIVRAVRR